MKGWQDDRDVRRAMASSHHTEECQGAVCVCKSVCACVCVCFVALYLTHSASVIIHTDLCFLFHRLLHKILLMPNVFMHVKPCSPFSMCDSLSGHDRLTRQRHKRRKPEVPGSTANQCHSCRSVDVCVHASVCVCVYSTCPYIML